MTNLKLRSFS